MGHSVVSFVSAAIIIGDELRRPHKMTIMSFGWPITAFGEGLFQAMRADTVNIVLLKTGWKDKMPLYQHETLFENLYESTRRRVA